MRVDVEKFETCPQCAADMPVDARFVTWCGACEWNVDPEPPRPEGDRLERARRALARRHGERLLAELTSGDPRTGRDAASALAHGIALAVHAATLVRAIGGVWWLVRGWGGPGMVPGLLLLALAWSLRPRAPHLPDSGPVLLRADAPGLYALVDEIARTVGTRGVDRIVVDTQPNASVNSADSGAGAEVCRNRWLQDGRWGGHPHPRRQTAGRSPSSSPPIAARSSSWRGPSLKRSSLQRSGGYSHTGLPTSSAGSHSNRGQT